MIKKIHAREILDSRGNPTVEVSLFTDEREFVSSVPSGASTGSYEAKELRDEEERFGGKGVLRAVENINKKIAPAIVGKDINPLEIDNLLREIDGTKDKSNLGANAILAVSMAVFRAAAEKEKKSLYHYFSSKFLFEEKIPTPCFNIINGGAHSGGGVSVQEFMLVPQEESFRENLRFGAEFYHLLKKKIKEKYGASSVNIGDEGGYVPAIKSSKEVLSLLCEVKEGARFILDVASTEFFKDGKYFFDGEEKSREGMIDFYKEIKNDFPILGIEDPLEENDFLGWGILKEELKETLIIGDDLLVTNIERMEMADEKNSCNAMILKVNQIGSISEAIETAKKAKNLGWKIIVSHRSGETNDSFIADFAVGIGADYIKSGAPARGERVAKYNRLLRIEEEIKNKNL